MANLTLRYLDELSYVLNRRHLATQGKASSVGDLLDTDEDRFAPVRKDTSQIHTAHLGRVNDKVNEVERYNAII